MTIKIEVADDREPVEDIWLGDDGPFTFYPPKSAPLMKVATYSGPKDERELEATKGQVEWLRKGFDPDDWDHLTARIEDDDDLLDWPHLFSLAEQLMGVATGRPTTSSRGSSATRRQRSSGARRKPTASTSTHDTPDESATS